MMHETTNYAQFKQDLNRPLDLKRVDKLLTAIADKDLGQLYPISVRYEKGYLYIVDGQHRFHTRSTLGLPVYYVVAEKGVTTEDIRNAESLHKDWSGNDYVNYYASQGKPDYVRLRDLMAETGWAASNMLVMRNSMTNIKSGELTLSVADVTRVKRSIHIYEQLVPSIPFRVERRIFYSACWRMATKKFALDELQGRLIQYRSMLYPCQRYEQYQKMLQDVYNYKRRSGKQTLVDL